MRPADAERVYLGVLRGMSGEQRMRVGMELYDMARGLAAASIRADCPGISESELSEKLKERMR